MKKRQRVNNLTKTTSAVEPVFQPNCASENAKILHKYTEFEVELWIDKHYESRLLHGDENGKREGIEEKNVQELIINAFKYLLDIYLRFPRFKFINFFEYGKTPTKERIVLKNIHDKGILNVVVEIHFLETSKYEVTVITAMEIDNFKISDGQYVLIFVENRVLLKRNVNKNFQEIYKLELS
ncbi:MAG: hypothetical protein ACSHXG_16025 [Maribacter stanieri]